MANKSNNKVAKDVKKNSKDKRNFMKDFKAELKKVIWPTPKQLFNNTAAVVTIVVIVTLIVLVLDLGFKTLNTKGINQLKALVENTTEQVNEVTSEEQVDVNAILENVTTDEEQQTTENTAE